MTRFSPAVALAIFLGGCGSGHEPTKTGAATTPPFAVSVVEARSTEWPSIYEAPGTVRAVSTATLASKVMGYVREVNVQPGDRVRDGQLLVVIDSRDLQAAVMQAKAAEQEARSGIAEAESGIGAAKAQLELAQVTFRRMEDLFEKKSISNQEFDEATARLRGAEAAHQMAISKRSQLDARIAQTAHGAQSASIMKSYSEIRAPFTGLIIEKRVEPGQMATPGTPLLTVEGAGGYRLEAAVQESMLGSIRLGQTVSVVLDAANLTVDAKVTEIVPSVDASSRAFLVKAALPPAPILRTGLFGRMRVQRGSEQVVSVPMVAVVHRDGLQSVFVAEGNTARMRVITTGSSREGQMQVLSGLTPGERVIYPRPSGLTDGAQVEVRR